MTWQAIMESAHQQVALKPLPYVDSPPPGGARPSIQVAAGGTELRISPSGAKHSVCLSKRLRRWDNFSSLFGPGTQSGLKPLSKSGKKQSGFEAAGKPQRARPADGLHGALNPMAKGHLSPGKGCDICTALLMSPLRKSCETVAQQGKMINKQLTFGQIPVPIVG